VGHFSEQDAVEMTKKLVSAIKYMHEHGVVHRDLKPENMLMTDSSKDASVKITDFGLSKITDGHSALMKTPCGTPGYIGERTGNARRPRRPRCLRPPVLPSMGVARRAARACLASPRR
jgi:hypothetical protein